MALGETLKVDLTKEARADVARIVQLWKDLLGASRGPFLLRDWSIADAFYTPGATRFATYGIDLAEFGDDGEFVKRPMSARARSFDIRRLGFDQRNGRA